MRFAVLGPLRVYCGDDDVTPSAPKQRRLLGVLLSTHGHWISIDRLIEEIWGPCPPKSGRDQLRWHVHQLRNRLGDGDVLECGDNGYSLRIRHSDIDSRRFEELCREADRSRDDPVGRGRLLAQALGLWRGEAFVGLGDAGAVRDEAMRLETMRLTAVAERVEADLRLGRHSELIAELEGLVADFPLRERFRAQLMLALYRSGRRAEALEVHRAGRALSVSRLGVEPGHQLRELERAILTDSVAAPEPRGAGMPVPAQLPPETAGFVGRQPEAGELTGLLSSGDGRAAVVSITGAGGVGKSALAVHIGHDLVSRFPDGQLYVRLRGDSADGALGTAEALRVLLRSLGVTVEDSMDVDELSARFRSATNGRRLLIVLDGARDAAHVRPLLPGCPKCGVIVTSRRRLTTIASAIHYNVDAMPDTDSITLLSESGGGERVKAEPVAAAELVRLCDRLPLAVSIAGARLRANPGWSVSDMVRRLRRADRRLDELAADGRAVRAVFAAEYRSLRSDPDGDEAARLFRLLGPRRDRDITVPTAAALADVSSDRAIGLLETLVAARLLESSVPGRYGCPDLLRLFAREHTNAQTTETQQPRLTMVFDSVAPGRFGRHASKEGIVTCPAPRTTPS